MNFRLKLHTDGAPFDVLKNVIKSPSLPLPVQAHSSSAQAGPATMLCSGCAAVLTVPEGAVGFRCPQCAAVNEHGAPRQERSSAARSAVSLEVLVIIGVIVYGSFV